MDPILQVLLSWQFILFGLAVAAVVYVFRLVIEYLASLFKADLTDPKNKLWNDLILPLAPIVFGVLGALVFTTFPYPGFTANAAGVVARGDRLIFGLVSGSLSTLMYRVIKALLYQKLVDTAQNLNIPGVTTTPTTTTAPSASGIDPIHLPSRGQL